MLIGKGSVLNICFAVTLGRIGVEESMIRPNRMILRAFDGIKTSVCEEINVKMLIGLCEFEVSRGGHSCRLQPTPQPTMDTKGAIPSSLHEK